MSQISPAAGVDPPVLAKAQLASSSSQREFTRAVVQAVGQLNQSGIAGADREVLFSINRTTRLPEVRVIDAATKEVISQWPAEYAVRLAESSTSTLREIQDESIL